MKTLGTMVPYLLKMLGKKPGTIMYPAVPAKVAEGFRGALKFDSEKCVGCKLCSRVCPANAIEIEKVEGEEKKFKAIVKMDKCVFCGQCVDSCNKKALENTTAFELAASDRASMRVEI